MTSMSTVADQGGAHVDAHEETVSLPYAGFGLRLVSGVLDLIVLTSVFFIFVSIAGFYLLIDTDWGRAADVSSNAVAYRAVFIVSLFALVLPAYFIVLWAWHGQTVGQMATRIAVTDRDGYHISLWHSIIRTVTWPLSVIPFGLGLVPVLFDDESRALHDMLAGTVVVELP